MLEPENLSAQEFYEVFDALKKKIPIYAPNWTNLQASDPGVTVLELMAWLDVIMHQYMSILPPETYFALLELLDVRPAKTRGSTAILSVVGLPQGVCIPQKAKWRSDAAIFENSAPLHLAPGTISHISLLRVPSNDYGSTDHSRADERTGTDGSDRLRLERFALADISAAGSDGLAGESRIPSPFVGKDEFVHLSCEELERAGGILLFGESKRAGGLEGNSFCISLTHCPTKGEWLTFYLALVQDKNRVEGVGASPMSKLAWEYWGEDTCFHPIEEVINVHSCDGIISLKIPEALGRTANGYCIRATLVWEEFDICPRIQSIHLNSFEVEQRDTLCDSVLIQSGELVEGEIHLSHYLAEQGKILLYSRCKDGFVPVEDFSIEQLPQKALTKIKPHTSQARNFLLVLFSAKMENKMILGSTTQISNQTLALEIANVKEDTLALLVVTPDGVYQRWELDDSLCKPRTFRYNAKDATIQFGDNFHGDAPLAAKDSVHLCRLATTLGERSNIKEGMISTSDSIIGGKIHQLTLARGGADAETLEDLKAKVSRLFAQQQRAVTLEDYQSIVRSTPGLVLQNVKVITDAQKNAVTVVVQGGGRAAKQPLECYRKSILSRLEQHRLIGTQIAVVWTQSIDLTISAQVLVSPYYRDAQQMVSVAVEGFIAQREIGSVFHYSALFGKLEALPCVDRVLALDIITNTSGVHKTQTEDILIPPSGMYRLAELKIELVKSLHE